MPRKLIRVSFIIPSRLCACIGQSLADIFHDGVVLSPERGGLSFKPGAADTAWTRVNGWLASSAALRPVMERIVSLGARKLKADQEISRDWLKESKASFPSQRIGKFFILPAWRKQAVPKGFLPIRLLQGQAFGTGLHQSTRLMLAAIGNRGFKPDERVLDVGAGSGILAFACLLSGGGQVDAVELEAAACAEMRANAAQNHFGKDKIRIYQGAFPGGLPRAKGRYLLILANLTMPVLESLMPRLRRRLQAGGRLWMSGIFGSDEAGQVARAVHSAGLKMVRQRKMGRWHFIETR